MPDTTKTRAQVVEMALAELMASDAANAAAAEDEAAVDDRVDGLFAELAARGVVSIADEDEIPIEWTGPLAVLLANECAAIFGKPKMADDEVRRIEQRLRTMQAAVTADEPLRMTYY